MPHFPRLIPAIPSPCFISTKTLASKLWFTARCEMVEASLYSTFLLLICNLPFPKFNRLLLVLLNSHYMLGSLPLKLSDNGMPCATFSPLGIGIKACIGN